MGRLWPRAPPRAPASRGQPTAGSRERHVRVGLLLTRAALPTLLCLCLCLCLCVACHDGKLDLFQSVPPAPSNLADGGQDMPPVRDGSIPGQISAQAGDGAVVPDAAVIPDAAVVPDAAVNPDAAVPSDVRDAAAPMLREDRLLDDFDDGDSDALDSGQGWYVFGDNNQQPSLGFPEEPGRGRVARTAGQGFTGWGAGMGLNLQGLQEEPGGSSEVFDARGYLGLRFDARLGEQAVGRVVHVSVLDPCGPDCQHRFSTPVTLSGSWASYEARFDQLEPVQENVSDAPLEISRLVGISFIHWNEAVATPLEDFDVLVDNVQFFGITP